MNNSLVQSFLFASVFTFIASVLVGIFSYAGEALAYIGDHYGEGYMIALIVGSIFMFVWVSVYPSFKEEQKGE